MYNINNPVAIGNPNIQPEKITTDELAVSWQPTSRLQTNLNYFQYDMRNIILPVAALYQNAGDQTGRGVEMEGTLDATNNLRLTGNFSWQHSKNEATGQDAGMAPHRHLFARADWRFKPQWQLGTTINHVAGRMREQGDTRARIPDYTMVDMILRNDNTANGWDSRIVITNLFNRNALEPTFYSVAGQPSDLPLPGRALYIQTEYKL
jgi:iron complex outermembrane receptor protein